MSKPIPTIQKYMTMTPHSIGIDQDLAHAHAFLKKHDIRHLPVLSGGTLVGIITERDLSLIETLRDVDPKKVMVEEAMTSSVYSVTPETPIDEVLSTMCEKKYGCVVVMQNRKVVGILTTVDVCRAFAELLHARLEE